MCRAMKSVRTPSPGRTSYTPRQNSRIRRIKGFMILSRHVAGSAPLTRLAQIRDWMLPGHAESDEGFRQEMLSVSYRGVRLVAAVEAVIALGSLAGWMPRPAALGILAIACATLGAARLSVLYPYNRLIAAVSASAASAAAVRSAAPGTSGDFALGAAAGLLLVAVTTVPLR